MSRKRLELLGGRLIDVVSDEDAEQADIVVCARADVPTPYTDNKFGVCSECGIEIQFRPYMPVKPRKLCIGCAMLLCIPQGNPQ